MTRKGSFTFHPFLFLVNATIHVASRTLGKYIGCLSIDASNSPMAKTLTTRLDNDPIRIY